MSYAFDSRLGAQLYQLLPEVYRNRDRKTGVVAGESGAEDLARYLDAHGYLLDLIHDTFEQQLRDVLPESSQDWLLPYFAQLLAAKIVSPDSKCKHAEVANAVSWRQRKGTLKCVEEIAEAVGEMEVEIQEGWKRVAMTPRIGMPLMPARVWDNTLDIDMSIPSEVIRHPGLPAAMVDLRRASRAVEALPTNPAARVTRFGGIRQTWRQENYHGVPCYPGSFDDISRRTVDIRSPDANNGHHHHRRLLAYMPPPAGLFPFEPKQLTWSELHTSLYEHLIEEKEENGVWLIRNKTQRIIEITDNVTLGTQRPYRIEGLYFQATLSVVDGGSLELQQVEASHVEVVTFSIDTPVLIARDCLFNILSVGSGIAKLDSCTVLTNAALYDVDAIDCIFMGISGTAVSGVIQYSRLPDNPPFHPDHMTIEDCTSDVPVFFPSQSTLAAMAVLAPNTPESIYAGASDGGEIGYFHTRTGNRKVSITGNFTGPDSLDLPGAGGYAFKDIVFTGNVEVTGGPLKLVRCAANSLTVKTALLHDSDGDVIPALSATGCLFDALEVENGLTRLEYCTVMQSTTCKYLQASDSIFAKALGGIEDMELNIELAGSFNCVRFSSVPADLDNEIIKALRLLDGSGKLMLGSNTMVVPVFIKFDYCYFDTNLNEYRHEYRAANFGEPGYGVLAQTTADTILFGAEDGGEMGVNHDKYYSLKEEAVQEKIKEFLPVGIEPVLIQDMRLLHVPPEQPG